MKVDKKICDSTISTFVELTNREAKSNPHVKSEKDLAKLWKQKYGCTQTPYVETCGAKRSYLFLDLPKGNNVHFAQ